MRKTPAPAVAYMSGTYRRNTKYISTAAVALAGCKKEKGQAAEEPEAFAFTVYPGSQYLAPLTELDKKANALMHPNQPQPPIAIYDTDAPLETVAAYYAKSYGYGTVAP